MVGGSRRTHKPVWTKETHYRGEGKVDTHIHEVRGMRHTSKGRVRRRISKRSGKRPQVRGGE